MYRKKLAQLLNVEERSYKAAPGDLLEEIIGSYSDEKWQMLWKEIGEVLGLTRWADPLLVAGALGAFTYDEMRKKILEAAGRVKEKLQE